MARRCPKYFFFLVDGLAILYLIELLFFEFRVSKYIIQRMKFPFESNKVTMEDMNAATGSTTEQEKAKIKTGPLHGAGCILFGKVQMQH